MLLVTARLLWTIRLEFEGLGEAQARGGLSYFPDFSVLNYHLVPPLSQVDAARSKHSHLAAALNVELRTKHSFHPALWPYVVQGPTLPTVPARDIWIATSDTFQSHSSWVQNAPVRKTYHSRCRDILRMAWTVEWPCKASAERELLGADIMVSLYDIKHRR